MRNKAVNLAKRHWALLVAIAFFWLAIGILLIRVMAVSGGQIVYGLDDPYIHMAMARNLAQHGVWGVTAYEFSSSSSSPLWTLFLASVYFVTGAREVTPLILNVIFATFLLVAVYWIYSKSSMVLYQSYLFVALLVMTFVLPLPTLTLIGMDTTLQVLIDVLFVYLVAKELSKEKALWLDRPFSLLLLMALLTVIVRYEGVFLVFGALMLFVLRRRWLLSATMAVMALLPLGIIGLISTANGNLWLPNSVLTKAGGQDLTSYAGISNRLWQFYQQFLQYPAYIYLLIAALLFYAYRYGPGKGFWERGQLMITMFVIAVISHLAFIQIADFFRYDAYLIALGLFVLIPVVFETFFKSVRMKAELIPKYAVIAMLCLLVIVPLEQRGNFGFRYTPQASRNIYEQQYQMGLFLQQYYRGASVAANDVGAINYLAAIRCVDLMGLGNAEVARERLSGKFNTAAISNITISKGVKIAIVYDDWFINDESLPQRWKLAGRWRIFNNVACGGEVVSFYAVDPAEESRLKTNLKEFSTRLPVNVQQSGKYTQ